METGLNYFGARYYSSDLSVWLSVDPMADLYPSMSPYTYCVNNPVRCVDPNGEEIVISESVDDQGNKVVNIKFTAALIDRTGYLGEKSKISDKEMETYKTAIAQSIQNPYSGTTVTGKQIGMVCSNYNKQMLNYGLLRTMSERKRGGCR